ncbi:MAG: RnfABCDGE type electron transport complex subunit G [Clostridioides sp.]|jgi:electron transport complex protein RnfG|nr:RnfABCDGE type electron transport complex subunit G [Clostridioides sp.]
MKKMIKLGLILLAVCIIASFSLSAVNNSTKKLIEEQSIIKNDELRKNVLPDATEFKKVEPDLSSLDSDVQSVIVEVYQGLDASGKTVGYTVKTSPSGYGGPFELIIGFTDEGQISSISTGTMSETPGLGSKASQPEFQEQFKGKQADTLEVVKGVASADNQIKAISGATITSTAVTKGVNAAIDLFNNVLVNLK